MAQTGVVNTPGSANKSWVEMCYDEYSSDSSIEDSKNVRVEKNESDTVSDEQKCTVTTIKQSDVVCQDENTPVKGAGNKEKVSEVETKTEVETKPQLKSPWGFSYASILTNSASKGNIDSPNALKLSSEKKDVRETAKKLPESSKCPKTVKREIQREFLQEDLSLSSHLDVIHMQSPRKVQPPNEDMTSPSKFERETRSAKKRLGQPQLFGLLNDDAVMPDEVLMPSPKKVTRLSSRRKREPGESPLTNKRTKHTSSGSHSTPKCVVPIEPPAVELELDEQILIRRQKQIDYGKNTIGYERYCQMVPKQKRHKKHPQTPPKHIKYSRRAWDGLVKQWRQQLHCWDPPGEGGGNFDISSMSEASSDTTSMAGSLPATPRDKPRRYSRTTRSSESSCNTVDDDGCSPLK